MVASCGMESLLFQERLMVWRLGKMCGALRSGLMLVSLVLLRFKVTKCWKIGWDKTFMHSFESPMGVLARLRWAREGEKGIWTKSTKG